MGEIQIQLASACGEIGTDYLGIDEEACSFFEHGWFEKAQEIWEKYKDCFPPAEAEAADGAKPR